MCFMDQQAFYFSLPCPSLLTNGKAVCWETAARVAFCFLPSHLTTVMWIDRRLLSGCCYCCSLACPGVPLRHTPRASAIWRAEHGLGLVSRPAVPALLSDVCLLPDPWACSVQWANSLQMHPSSQGGDSLSKPIVVIPSPVGRLIQGLKH